MIVTGMTRNERMEKDLTRPSEHSGGVGKMELPRSFLARLVAVFQCLSIEEFLEGFWGIKIFGPDPRIVTRRVAFPFDEVGDVAIVIVIFKNGIDIVLNFVFFEWRIRGFQLVLHLHWTNSARISWRVVEFEAAHMNSFHVSRIGDVCETKIELRESFGNSVGAFPWS